MSLLPACVHVQTRLGCLSASERTPIEASASMSLPSRVLDRLRREAGLSFSALDRVALQACGRRWCMFRDWVDYDATCRAVAARLVPHPEGLR